MGNILDQVCGENHNTHFVLNRFFFFKIRTGYNVEKYDESGTLQMTVGYGACAWHAG